MAPVMDSLAISFGDRLKITKMEVDPNPNAVAAYKVEGVPAFRLFINGELVQSAEGAMPKAKLEEMINDHLAVA
jgi:thioredoxin 1